MKRISKAGDNRETIIDSAVEKPLLSLHGAIDIESFWKAVQGVIEAALPGCFVGMTLQHNPILPMIARWTTTDIRRLFQLETTRGLPCRTSAQQVRASQRCFSEAKRADEIDLLSPIHGAAEVPVRVGPVFLERPKTHLRDRDYAHGKTWRSRRAEIEVASPPLPAFSDRTSSPRLAGARALSPGGL